jgi:hypothetical protein
MASGTRHAMPAPARSDAVGRMLELQRTAGNQAVTQALAGSQPLVVQRHSSWEHAMLGDTPPGQLGRAAVTQGARIHVVWAEWQRMRFFRDDPGGDPRGRFPDVRWVQLRGSGLWVSNGELNALSDYLPDPSASDTQTREQLVPVLQRMRNTIYDSCAEAIGLHPTAFEGAAWSWAPGAAGEVLALDSATAGSGTNRYKGLVARNACHFAPFSWERWTLFHNEARDAAVAHHTASGAVAPVTNVDTSVDENQRQAVLKNGYADHFLQDSFAAGHLVNKTLIMQWFVDYLNGLSWAAKPWFGMPSADVMASMGSAQQPGISGQDRYGQTPSPTETSDADRASGTTPADPQTAQERASRAGRESGSGVVATPGRSVDQNYQAYLAFLNSAFLQAAAGAVHDHFNEGGLTVRNRSGDQFKVGGDDTLLSESDQVGAELAGRAAELSRTAIQELLASGTTAITVDQIFALTPQTIVWTGETGRQAPRELSLAQFQEDVVHDLCIHHIFPDLVSSMKGQAIRGASAEMVPGGVSVDSGTPTPAR